MSLVKIFAAWALILFSCNASSANAATLKVPSGFPTIQASLAAAHQGDIILIAPGTYYESNLEMPSGVTLQGSSIGGSETVIDGQFQGRILSFEFLDELSSLRNLVFTGGYANGETSYDKSGGAVFILCSPFSIVHCRFDGNIAETFGGAVRCMGTSSALNVISGCIFENNSAAGGGALDCSYDASPEISHCQFNRNSAGWGGALACRGNSNPQVSYCRFDENQTAGELSHGGAVLSFFWGSPDFVNCSFSRNTADVGGAIYSGADSPAKLDFCTITDNTGLSQGAGIFTEDPGTEIQATIIAFQEGPGVQCLGSVVPQITCSNIYGNRGGDWIGNIAPLEGVEGNLRVDPLFCPTDLDDEYWFNLQDGSPCSVSRGACADMGAWPIGCPIPLGNGLSVPWFDVTWAGGFPTLVWQVSGIHGNEVFRLARTSEEQPELEQDLLFTIGPEGEFIAQDTGFVPLENEHYFYRLYLGLDDGEEVLLDIIPLGTPPRVLNLARVSAWPNPFNPQTQIHFELASSQKVQVEIYGIDGQRVRILANQVFSNGPQNLVWDGRDTGGRALASGPYVVRVKGEVESKLLKVTLLK